MKWAYKTLKLSELKPAKYNPRKLSAEQEKNLTKSIDKFNICEPIVINTNNTIIGGHQRYKILKKQNVKEVSVMFPDKELTLDQEKELNLRLNKNVGEFDFDLLVDFDKSMLEDVGFIEDELNKVFPIEVSEKDDEVPETKNNEYGVVKGDIWKLGKHRIMCGDSTCIDDVEKLMDGKQADMYLSDPPYNVDYTGKTKDSLKIINDNKEDGKFRQFLRDAFSSVNVVLKCGAVFYIWHADSEGYNFRGACKDNEWKVRQCLIWRKSSMVMGRQDYHWQHEPCLYGWKDGAGHLWASDRKQTTILNFDRPSKSTLHPTMKPVELLAYQLTNNTKGNDIVLDTFLGSGSTLIACEKTNRICYGMELDEHYVSVCIKRWEEYTNGKAVKL